MFVYLGTLIAYFIVVVVFYFGISLHLLFLQIFFFYKFSLFYIIFLHRLLSFVRTICLFIFNIFLLLLLLVLHKARRYNYDYNRLNTYIIHTCIETPLINGRMIGRTNVVIIYRLQGISNICHISSTLQCKMLILAVLTI